MRIIGHGIDIVETARVARMLEEHGERFLERVFSRAERDYCLQQPARAAEHLAARFAAKEAAFKALGTGWTRGVGWTEIEVARAASGEPSLIVTGRASELARERGVSRWLVSLSHAGHHAVASVLALE